MTAYKGRKHAGFVRRGVALALAVLTALMPMTAEALTYRDVQTAKPGNPVMTEQRSLAAGIGHETWRGVNASGKTVVYQALTMDASERDAGLLVWSGTSVTERNTLTTMMAQARAQGYTVVGGVNGDFFNLATGAPIGLVIHEGSLLSSDGSYAFALGIRLDGTTVIGKPTLRYVLSRNGNAVGGFALNKEQTDNGPFAYTPSFGARAGSTQNGVEVVVSVPSTRLTVGGYVEGTVLEVRQDTQGTAIGEGRVVLSARTGQAGFDTLSSFLPGDVIRLEVQDPTGSWTGVSEAVGGLHRLLENGVPVAGLSATNINPATLAGRKPDGTLVLLEVDGRQTQWSNGISYSEGASAMLAMGCTDAIVLDGGGSSTLSARLPGNVTASLQNRPSDGSERKVANTLLLISKTAPALPADPVTGLMSGEAATRLHLYPGTRYLLPGAVAQWQIKATDAGYHAAGVPAGLSLSSTGGWFDGVGNMTVTGGFGLHHVLAQAGAATGEASFIIPEHLTEIRLSATSITLAPGESVDVKATGYLEGVEVTGVDASYLWQVDPQVGTVTPEGVFTAAGEPGATGTLQVSWNSSSVRIPVSIARNPVVLEEFEQLPVWKTLGTRAAGTAARSLADTTQALFGDGLLRLWYDFRPSSDADAGTAGVYAGPAGPDAADGSATLAPIPLEGTPTGIGVWVYGNNSHYWLRGKLTDATGREVDLNYTPEYQAATGTGGIDWTGWKYVEASIPAGLVAPYQLSMPIRVMCPQEELKGTGMLLFDRFRAMYGVRRDDTVAPEIAAVWPPEGGTLDTGTFTLASRSYEEAGGSGFAPERTRLVLDGIPQAGLVQTWDADGALRVTAPLGAAVPLAGGSHVAVLHVEDQFGNKTERTWSFRVETATPRLDMTVPEAISSGEVFDVTVQLKTPNPMKSLAVDFKWDPAMLEPVDMNGAVAGVQLGTEKYVTDAKIAKNEADAAAGVWHFSVASLNSTIKAAERKVLTLRFRAKTNAAGTTAVSAIGAVMQVAGVSAPQPFSFPAAGMRIEPAYHLDVRGLETGGTSQMTVTDRNGSLVGDATVFLAGTGALAKTDAYGTAASTVPGTFPAGTKLSFQVVKNGLSSAVASTVVGASGTARLLGVTVSPISQPGGMTVHWLSATASGSYVQVLETTRYAGTFPADAQKAASAVTSTTLTDPGTGAKLYEHKAVFYGLKSGTGYKWRITDSANVTGETGSFTTPRSGVGEPFTFGFVTDPQAVDAAGYVPFRGILRRMLGQAPDLSFVILGGDMVDDGAKVSQWWSLFETAGVWLRSLPILAVPGNHEYKNDAQLAGYKAFWGLPATGPSGMGETCYTVRNGDARFYMLDTQGDLDKQLAWLKTEKAASDTKWNIVVMHRGIYGGFYDEAEYRAKAGPVFDALGIDLVLSGHDHTWQRTTMKAGVKVKPGEGTTYITGGASGGKFYDAPARSWAEVSYDGNAPSYTLVSVFADRLVVSASHADGASAVRHDAFTISKP